MQLVSTFGLSKLRFTCARFGPHGVSIVPIRLDRSLVFRTFNLLTITPFSPSSHPRGTSPLAAMPLELKSSVIHAHNYVYVRFPPSGFVFHGWSSRTAGCPGWHLPTIRSPWCPLGWATPPLLPGPSGSDGRVRGFFHPDQSEKPRSYLSLLSPIEYPRLTTTDIVRQDLRYLLFISRRSGIPNSFFFSFFYFLGRASGKTLVILLYRETLSTNLGSVLGDRATVKSTIAGQSKRHQAAFAGGSVMTSPPQNSA